MGSRAQQISSGCLNHASLQQAAVGAVVPSRRMRSEKASCWRRTRTLLGGHDPLEGHDGVTCTEKYTCDIESYPPQTKLSGQSVITCRRHVFIIIYEGIDSDNCDT